MILRIGELSKQTGISQRMLRYYEQEGLLAPSRTRAGYREYNPSSVTLVRHIRNLSESGMKLKSIKMLLPCISGEESSPQFVGCPQVKATLQKELENLDVKLKELVDSRNAVAGFLQQLIPEKLAQADWTEFKFKIGNNVKITEGAQRCAQLVTHFWIVRNEIKHPKDPKRIKPMPHSLVYEGPNFRGNTEQGWQYVMNKLVSEVNAKLKQS